MSDLPAKIVAGLDYWYGRAVFPLLYPGEHSEHDLEKYVGDVRFALELKTMAKSPKTGKWCQEYRAALAGLGGDLVLDTLNIVESYSAAVGARKLEERLRQALFEKRQLRLPGM